MTLEEYERAMLSDVRLFWDGVPLGELSPERLQEISGEGRKMTGEEPKLKKDRPLWDWEIGAIVGAWRRRVLKVKSKLAEDAHTMGALEARRREQIDEDLDRLASEMEKMVSALGKKPGEQE